MASLARLAATGTIAAALIIGCSGPSGGTAAPAASPARSASPAASATGVIRGHLLWVGGPAPGAAEPHPGSVVVAGTGGRYVVAVGPDGAYSLSVAPGRYTLRGGSPGYLDGNGGCTSSGDVIITARGSATIDTLCPLR